WSPCYATRASVTSRRTRTLSKTAPGVLVIGAGGLGCPAALALAAAGVPRLGLVDDDRVDATNLPRQVLDGHADLGAPNVRPAGTSRWRGRPAPSPAASRTCASTRTPSASTPGARSRW